MGTPNVLYCTFLIEPTHPSRGKKRLPRHRRNHWKKKRMDYNGGIIAMSSHLVTYEKRLHDIMTSSWTKYFKLSNIRRMSTNIFA